MTDKKILPYSHQRIKKVMLEDYWLRVERIPSAYKENRKKGYKEHYRLIDITNGQTFLTNVTLNALRMILTEEDYPLHDESEV